MRSWPIALAFLASSTAVAGFNPFAFDRGILYDFTDTVSIEGTVEVPLFRPAPGSSQDCIEVTLPDGSVHLFELVIGKSGVSVSEGFAKAAGAKVKKVSFKDGGSKSSVTTLDGFNIGAASFSNVPASVDFSSSNGSSVFSAVSTIERAGSIGITGFSQLAGAVIHSEGVLRLAPASQGETVLAGIENANQIAYTSQDLSVVEFSKKKIIVTAPMPIVLEGTFGDQDTTIAFGTRGDSYVSVGLSEGLDLIQVGAHQLASDAFSVAGIGGTLVAEVNSGMRLYDSQVDLQLGESTVAGWDVAWSPNNMAMSVRQADKSSVQLYSEQAISQLLESLEEKEGEEGADTKTAEGAEGAEDGPNKAHAATYGALASVSMLSGDQAKALEYADLAVAADAEDCSVNMMRGGIALLGGKMDEAKESFAAADALYAPWAALDLETRKELEKEAKDDQPKKQASACFQAKNGNAMLLSVEGDVEALSKLDIGQENMSWLSAAAVGNAYLASGSAAEAVPAFLQVSRLERNKSWAGLGIAQSAQGHHEKAIGNLEQAMWESQNDLELARHFVDAVTAGQGAEEAAKSMAKIAGKMPTNGSWQLALSEAQVAAGLDGTAALTAAEVRFQWELSVMPTSEAMGQLAHAKIARGDYATARAIANKAMNSGISPVSAFTAMAACELNDGNVDNAKSLLVRAAATGNSAHAARLAEELVVPAPEVPVEEEELEQE